MHITEPGLYRLRNGRYVEVAFATGEAFAMFPIVSVQNDESWKLNGSKSFNDCPNDDDIVSGPYTKPMLLPPPEPEFIEGYTNVHLNLSAPASVMYSLGVVYPTALVAEFKAKESRSVIAMAVPIKFPNPKYKKV